MGWIDSGITKVRTVATDARSQPTEVIDATSEALEAQVVAAVAPRYAQVLAAESQWIDIDGPVHYVDYGGPAGARTMVLVHGLMGAHVNWLALVPELTDEFRVIALDLVGHGRTERAGRGTDVRSNQQVLHRFLEGVVDEPVVLVGNSMGGLISILQAASEPETVDGLVLVAPALPAVLTEIPSSTVVRNYLPLAVPGLGTALLSAQQRTSDVEGLIRSLLDIVTADPDRVPEDVVRGHVELAEVRLQIPGTPAGYQAAAQSTVRSMLQVRDYAATIGSIEAPVLLIQGEQDKVLSPTGARRIAEHNPHWDFESLPGVGHAPMLEVPEQLAGSIKDWAVTRLP
jgi:pimeloyl-ACP methyl ester carboxylesterase